MVHPCAQNAVAAASQVSDSGMSTEVLLESSEHEAVARPTLFGKFRSP